MIRSLRAEHRRDLGAYGESVHALFRGEDSEQAYAAAIDVAEVLTLYRMTATRKE